MKKSLILALFSALVLIVAAQESTSGYHVLRLPTSARVAAMGGENISASDDDVAVGQHNPALLSNVSPNTLGLSFMTYADGARWMGAQYVRGYGERHTAAIFAQHMNYGEMTETDAGGNDLGRFSPKDIVIGAGYSYLLSERWAGGATLKTVISNIAEYRAAALAVDLGVNYFDDEQDLSISVAARNLGAQVQSYDNRTETVPYTFQAGFTKGLKHMPMRFSITATDLSRWKKVHYFVADGETMSFGRLALNHLVVSADWLLSDVITLTAGYNFRRGYELKAAGGSHWAGFTAGANLNFSKIRLHLAYAQYHKSTASLMGTFAYSF